MSSGQILRMKKAKDQAARKRLGAAIRERREELGYSQEELAFESNLHRSYLGGVERGERNPALKNILKICEALKISAEELFSRAGL